MLQSDLARQGVDLSIDSNVAYFDVANRRVGINTATTVETLTVDGNVLASQYYLGNISNTTGANIYIEPTAGAMLQIVGTNAFAIPTGNTTQSPNDVPVGSLRYNTDTTSPEFYNGTGWITLTATIGYQTFSGNGTGNTYPLTQTTTTGGALVSLNGVQQTPDVAYTIVGNTIVFAEVPLTTDTVDVRFVSPGQTGGLILNGSAPTNSNSPGFKGQVAYDSSYVYICVNTDTWIRANIQNSF